MYSFAAGLGRDSSIEIFNTHKLFRFYVCAESFMHMAIEVPALIAHTKALREDPNTPPEVINAWGDVFGVLLKYKDIIGKRKWKGAKKGKLPPRQPGAQPKFMLGARTGKGSAKGPVTKVAARPQPSWMTKGKQGSQQTNSTD